MKSRILIFVMFICISVQGQNITPDQNKFDKMSWFSEAKLGIFIHWGIYSGPQIADVNVFLWPGNICCCFYFLLSDFPLILT